MPSNQDDPKGPGPFVEPAAAPYGNPQPHGNQQYGNQPYGNPPYGNPPYGNQAYATPPGMGMPPGAMPGTGMPPGMPGVGMPPGAMPGGYGYGPNPMFAFMQMMNMFAQGGAPGGIVDPAAMPFSTVIPPQEHGDSGLDEDIIRPAHITARVKHQKGVPTGSVLDLLCLDETGEHALGGVPMGCTIAFAGPPGRGKTRTVLAALCRIAASGEKVALLVAEEGFHDGEASGRDDLCSRLEKIGRKATGLDEKAFEEQVLANVFVMEAQYHKGKKWDDIVLKYRYLIEKESIRFVVVDSLSVLDPTKSSNADKLSALKTYNHEMGVTCICVGQIRDTGDPVGGEALMHTADVVFLLEELTLGSKEMAAMWGGSYRDRIGIIRAVKSVTTPTFEHPIRVEQAKGTGVLVVHPDHPEEYAVPVVAGA